MDTQNLESSSLPEEAEPNPKRFKLPISDADQIPAATNAALVKPPTYKRRKIAIFFAYCGAGYQGMQKNPGAKTIEADLEEALYQSSAVPSTERSQPRKYDWARSARTDKGVSAVGQVASGRFFIDPPGFVERLNSNLPAQIRVFGFKRVTGSFNAQKFCDRRRYVYLIPVFALDGRSHVVLDSHGNEICFECSKKGRSIVRGIGKRSCDFSDRNGDGIIQSGILSNTLENKEECVSFLVNDGEMVEGKKGEFCYGEKERERFNRVLRCYVGTHNFHNFTSRITAQDPSAKRYIISFNADKTVEVDGIEFVKCEVVGQSFLLHQIRKMIGLAVVIMRDVAPETLIETAFRKDVKINVPVAPEVGLYLDECFFSPYNRKWKDSHEEVSMKAYTEEAEDFKMKYIYPHIASTEHKDGTVALWLHYLNHKNYPDLLIGTNSREENVEPENFVTSSNNRSSSSINLEVENACTEVNGSGGGTVENVEGKDIHADACIKVNGSGGGTVSPENIVVKDIHAGGDGNNDLQNVEVKNMDQ